MTAVAFDDRDAVITFDDFGPDSYQLFLKAKAIPEYKVEYHEDDATYAIRTPKRFARMLGVTDVPADPQPLDLSAFLFDDQREIVRRALEAERFACWSDCGLGKTLITLEWARHVVHRTGGKVLIVTLNEIVPQIIAEAAKFYGDSLPVERLRSRDAMRQWMHAEGAGVGITNYEKWNPGKLEDQVVSEARCLAGIALDESSRLKAGGGKQKWAIIHSCKGVRYKLSCTATPAPNDVMEFASQASFLEKLRSEGEIIWTYFVREERTHRWTVKRHARKAFFQFMASWSIYVRDPKRYGWRLDQVEVPKPTFIPIEIEPNEQQREAARTVTAGADGQQSMFQDRSSNAIERLRLSQIAKGFLYRKGGSGKYDRIPSDKPEQVASIAKYEVEQGRQVLVWTLFDAETALLSEELTKLGVSFDTLTGKTKEKDRATKLAGFQLGNYPVLVSRPSVLGYGINLQNVAAMIFSGFDDSYESFYQAIRRAYRFGQTESVRVYLPCVKELEEDMLENLYRKQSLHEASIADMERAYIDASKEVGL